MSSRFRCLPFVLLAIVALAASFLLASCGRASRSTSPAGGAPAPGPGTIQGTVEFASHARAADVFVWLEPDVAYPSPSPESLQDAFAVTDSAGAFSMSDVPAGHYFVLAGIARNYFGGDPFDSSLSDSLVASQAIEVRSAGLAPAPVRLRLVVPGVFRARVLEASSSLPARALVGTTGALAIASTDSAGTYTLAGVAPGTWPVLAAEFVDSVTVLTGRMMGTIAAPGDTVVLPDIGVRLGPAPAPGAAALMRREALIHAAAARAWPAPGAGVPPRAALRARP